MSSSDSSDSDDNPLMKAMAKTQNKVKKRAKQADIKESSQMQGVEIPTVQKYA